MNDKLFFKITAVVVTLCLIGTIGLIGYTVHLYKNVSILAYIANESER